MLKIFNKINWLQYQEMLLVLLLIIATVLLNKPVGDSFWRTDDPAILKCAIDYSWWEHFIIPESYQCLSAAHLTSWVTFSYALDYNLFGLEPKFFYYHQIFSICLISIFSFILLRLYVNTYIAFIGTFLFLLGTSLWVSSQALLHRHYIEGLLFSIISIHFFILSLRFQKYRYAFLGCLFYIFATSAKEIYVPLVGILLFIPEGRLKERFYFSIPYFIWGVIYIVWRKYMLDLYIGSYQASNYSFEQLTNNLINIFVNIPNHILAGENATVIFYTISLIAMFLLYKKGIFLIISSIVVLTLPILPMGIAPAISEHLIISSRFVLLIWWSFCVLFIIAYNKTLSKIYLFVLFSIILGLFSWRVAEKRIEAKKILKPIAAEFDTQGRFFWQENEYQSILTYGWVERTGWYFKNLKEIKQRLYKKNSPRYYNKYYLPLLKEIPQYIWQYNSVCQCMEKIAFDTIKNIFLDLKSKTKEKPLSISFVNNSNIISWELKPYQEGKYVFLSEERVIDIFPMKGQTLINNQSWNFYICYESPEGWITYSPKFTLEKDQIIDWKRP